MAPPLGWLAALAQPPWARAIALTMASPRPAPSSLRARPMSAGRAKRWKACVRYSAGNPGPLSLTSMRGPASTHHAAVRHLSIKSGKLKAEAQIHPNNRDCRGR